MTSELTIANQAGLLVGAGPQVVPALVAAEGERTVRRYVEFFTANIRNPNTRAAYARAASGFLAWCEVLGLALPGIQPVHVAAWVEQLGREGRSAPTVKQNLAGRGSDPGYTRNVEFLGWGGSGHFRCNP